MNFKVLLPLSILLLILSSLQSCKEPVKVVDTSFLSGSWVIVNAKRNAKSTTTLNEAYFVFNADSTMRTNFMGEEITGTYKITDNIISQESKDNFKYTIVDLSQDSLILSTEIMKYNFEFYLLNERLDPFNKKEDDTEMMELDQGLNDIES